MITFALQSGSSGNCIYVESGDVRLLFDAGISGRQARLRIADRGREIRSVTALIVSHEHQDHIGSARTYQRFFGMPIWTSEGTQYAGQPRLRRAKDVRSFRAGQTLSFGDVRVHTLPTPHDAMDGVAFVVEAEGKRLGIFTDIGRPFDALRQALETVDAAYLESNYDPMMLERGAYSPALKERVRGGFGHLSNGQAAELARRHAGKARWIALSHLSGENNHPEVALSAHRAELGDLPLFIAPRGGLSPTLEV